MVAGTATAGQAQSAGSPQPVAGIPFPIAARQMSRVSFDTGAVAAPAAANQVINPIQLPATGYLRHINLEVIVTGTGGTSPAFTADSPFNALATVEFKTASGNDIIVPLTGYQLYLRNKYCANWASAPWCDNKMSKQFAATAPSAHFFLQISFELDPNTGLGCIPATASNRSYQLLLTLAGVASYMTGAPTVTVQVKGTAWYWSVPPAAAANGTPQEDEPASLGTLTQVQLEMPALTPGDKLTKLNNVGNVIRTIIFTLRNSSGARIDTNGWPLVSEIYLDNEPMFYLTQNEWEDVMVKCYGFSAASKDIAQGLDTGVYVIPFHNLPGNNLAGDASNSRSQYLATVDASQLQIRGTSWGSAVSTLEVMTESVVPEDASVLYSK